MKIALLTLLALSASSLVSAQSFDNSGNSLLNGAYNLREVAYGNFDNSGGMRERIALTGVITFDGAGSYSFVGQRLVSTSSGPESYNIKGVYETAPTGLTRIQSLLYDDDLEAIYGLVSKGVFVGSATEGVHNDITVAVAVGSTAASVSTLQGSYWMGAVDFTNGDPTQGRDALVRLTANGSGSIAASTARGYVGTGTTVINQSIAAFGYTLANGLGTFSFPSASGNQALIAGNKSVYVSPDGNFFMGGASNGYDLVFGVRAPSGTASDAIYTGLYYHAGVEQNNGSFASSGSTFATYWGSYRPVGGGKILRVDRNAPFDGKAYDYGFDTSYSVTADGSYDLSGSFNAVGDSGIGVVGISRGPYVGLFVAVKGPDFSGNGVFINPAGVVNAASNAPFTAGIAPGELITIYGNNLAAGIATGSLPFPNTVGNVQVKMNGALAPIVSVSPTQVSAIVPYSLSSPNGIIQVQVINNGTASNVVSSFVNTSAPGIFTIPPGGIGYGAVLHADYTLVDAAHPAAKGETVLVYLTGLGKVSPDVIAGTAGPINPFSLVSDPNLVVYIDGTQSTVSYKGLAPGLAGLYQLNVTVPSNANSGDVYLEIWGSDAFTSQARLPIK